jgi:hypothetical protein
VSRPGWVPLASGGAARADALKRRLAMILSNSPARTGRRAVAVGLLAAGLAVLPLRPGLADDVVAPVADPAAGEPGDVLAFKFPDDGAQPDPRPKAKPAPADEAARRSDLRLPSSYSPAAADVAGLRDELELLEAAGQTKAAQVRAAEVAVTAARRQLDLLKSAGKSVVSSSEMANVATALETAEAQLDVRKAEYGEHAVRVKQAKRRLEAAVGDRPAEARLGWKLKTADTPAANPRNRKVPDTDAAPGADAMRQLRDELAKTQAVLQDLTAKRQQLEDQLKVITQQQGAVMSQMEKLRAIMEDVYKKYPDAGGPKKP